MKDRKIAVLVGKKCASILIYLLSFICILCLPSGPALADLSGFQNGNFSNGFAGWSGNLIFTGNVDPASDPHFSLTSQGAQIRNDDFELTVMLYQDFLVGPLSSGNNKLFLNFWLQLSPTLGEQALNISVFLSEYDPLTDQIYNPLNVLEDSQSLDFLTGANVSVNVASMANKMARLALTLSDSDFITPDFLNVGNISLSEQPANPVPIPSDWLLVISGLAGLGVLRRKSERIPMGRKRA